MSLRFIYGRAGCGKTHYCLNEIKSKIEEDCDKPLVLLVPEQFTFQAERDLIRVLKTGGILKSEVLSFRRLAFRVFNEAGGITYPHIHPAGKCMMIYRILDNMRDSLGTFFKSAQRQGFVNTISTLITEFKRYNVTPEILDNVTQSIESGLLKDKLNDLNIIYSAFEKQLRERYRDSDDDLTLAAEKLGRTSLYDGAEIWIDGFAGFTPQEYRIIGQLLRKAERVNVSLCTDCLEDESVRGCTDVFSSVKAAKRKFAAIADENCISIDSPIYLGSSMPIRFSDSGELYHLEQNLNAYPYKVYSQKTKDIQLFTSINIFSEIEAAAREIVSLCRDRKLRWRDIAVVTGNLDGYEKMIEVIFTEYKIPYFIDKKVEIMDHVLARMILSVLDIFNENWSYESVFRYLKTGLTGVDMASIDLLENYVLACGIRGSRWTDEREWDLSPDLIPDEKSLDRQKEQLENINSTRFAVSRPLLEFRKKTKGRRTAEEFCTGLYELLCTLEVPERIERIIEKLRQDGNLNLANEYAQVWNIIMEVFDQAVEVMGDETFGIERFTETLKIGLGEYKIGLIPASLDQVLIGSVERSKSHEIKALYILGANDGVFPAPVAKEGILSDRDRNSLNTIGVEIASDTRTQAFDEQYLVYRAMTTAASMLRISWSIADQEGRALRPSIIVSRLKKLFPNITETSNIISGSSGIGGIELVAGLTPTFRHMVSAFRQKADGQQIDAVWQDVFCWFKNEESWKAKCQAACTAFSYKNTARRVSRDKIGALYGQPVVTSVSKLEKYTSCPFAFYVQYALGARERKVYRLSAPDVGTFMHTAIERFSRVVSEVDLSWRSIQREWCDSKVSEIVDDMLQNMKGTGISASKRYTALTVRLKRVISRAVWLIAEQIKRSSFTPSEYEIGFGEKDKYPPIKIELDSGETINLTGRIDRIDTLKTEDGTYLRIVDYKSGNKDFRLSDVFYGLQLQLVTYMDAIQESGNNDSPYLPGGILYFKIDDPIIRLNGSAPEEDIELAIMKQLRMKGLLLADVKLIKEMDNTIDGASVIIPATVNKGDVLGKNSSAATMHQFNLLRKYVGKLLKDLCSEIMKGNVSIKPYKKKGTTSCQYCNYLPVCQFDTSLPENSYNLLYDKENEEVWNLMGDR